MANANNLFKRFRSMLFATASLALSSFTPAWADGIWGAGYHDMGPEIPTWSSPVIQESQKLANVLPRQSGWGDRSWTHEDKTHDTLNAQAPELNDKDIAKTPATAAATVATAAAPVVKTAPTATQVAAPPNTQGIKPKNLDSAKTPATAPIAAETPAVKIAPQTSAPEAKTAPDTARVSDNQVMAKLVRCDDAGKCGKQVVLLTPNRKFLDLKGKLVTLNDGEVLRYTWVNPESAKQRDPKLQALSPEDLKAKLDRSIASAPFYRVQKTGDDIQLLEYRIAPQASTQPVGTNKAKVHTSEKTSDAQAPKKVARYVQCDASGGNCTERKAAIYATVDGHFVDEAGHQAKVSQGTVWKMVWLDTDFAVAHGQGYADLARTAPQKLAQVVQESVNAVGPFKATDVGNSVQLVPTSLPPSNSASPSAFHESVVPFSGIKNAVWHNDGRQGFRYASMRDYGSINSDVASPAKPRIILAGGQSVGGGSSAYCHPVTPPAIPQHQNNGSINLTFPSNSPVIVLPPTEQPTTVTQPYMLPQPAEKTPQVIERVYVIEKEECPVVKKAKPTKSHVKRHVTKKKKPCPTGTCCEETKKILNRQEQQIRQMMEKLKDPQKRSLLDVPAKETQAQRNDVKSQLQIAGVTTAQVIDFMVKAADSMTDPQVREAAQRRIQTLVAPKEAARLVAA